MNATRKLCTDEQLAEFIIKLKSMTLDVTVKMRNEITSGEYYYIEAFIPNIASLDKEMFVAFESTTGLCFIHTTLELYEGEYISDAKLYLRKTELVDGVLRYEGHVAENEDEEDGCFDEDDCCEDLTADPNVTTLSFEDDLSFTIFKLENF
jgi:hypothetical protein